LVIGIFLLDVSLDTKIIHADELLGTKVVYGEEKFHNPDILKASCRCIAAGCGMEVQDVNRLIKQFREAQKMMKMFQKTGGNGLGRMFG
jgi:signal recognition particle GTPase